MVFLINEIKRHTTAIGFDSELRDNPVKFYPVSNSTSYKSSLKTPELSQSSFTKIQLRDMNQPAQVYRVLSI